MYRTYEGSPVTGQQVLHSLLPDLERGREVGRQTILALVCGNEDISKVEIEALIQHLRQAIFTHGEPQLISSYRLALEQCQSELTLRNR